MHVTPDMTLQSHLYLYNAIVQPFHFIRVSTKTSVVMKTAVAVVVMIVLSMADARPKAIGITKVSHNVRYGVLFFVT